MSDQIAAVGPRLESAVGLSQALAQGATTAREVTEFYLAMIERQEGYIRAWAHLDAEAARRQAAASDKRRRAGKPLSALDGIPIGIKDNIDTVDFPTEMGSPIHAGRRPTHDAAIVSRLRALGMVILGKTVTSPFGESAPTPTVHPTHPDRTLGLSSVGSAAAVAAGMVPLTVNTQNTSSTTRPASYAGVTAYKPTHGTVPLAGTLLLSPLVTQIAFMGSTLEDIEMLADHTVDLAQSNQEDEAARCAVSPTAPSGLGEGRSLRIAAVRGPWWNLADADADLAFSQFVERAGISEVVELPQGFGKIIEAHTHVLGGDIAVALEKEYAESKSLLPDEAIADVELGLKLTAADYARALRSRADFYTDLLEAMEGYDALVTLSTPGGAPRAASGFGDGTFSMAWTFLGMPILSLPVLTLSDGLPLGLLVITRRQDDRKLFAAGKHLRDLKV